MCRKRNKAIHRVCIHVCFCVCECKNGWEEASSAFSDFTEKRKLTLVYNTFPSRLRNTEMMTQGEFHVLPFHIVSIGGRMKGGSSCFNITKYIYARTVLKYMFEVLQTSC